MTTKYVPKSRNKKISRDDILPSERIFQVVQEFFDVDREALLTKSKCRRIAYPRQVCIYFMDKYSFHDKAGISVIFGWKNANAAGGALKAMSDYIATDENVRDQIGEIEKILKP
jgi:chromosomal replication initiator protein